MFFVVLPQMTHAGESQLPYHEAARWRGLLGKELISPVTEEDLQSF